MSKYSSYVQGTVIVQKKNGLGLERKERCLSSAFSEYTGLVIAPFHCFDLRVWPAYDYSSYNELMSIFLKSYNSEFSINHKK